MTSQPPIHTCRPKTGFRSKKPIYLRLIGIITALSASPLILGLWPQTTYAIDVSTIPNTPWSAFPDVGTLVSTLLKDAYVVAGILLLVLFLAGGFSILTAGDDPKKSQSGKDSITWAVAGFFIIFCSYWILQIVRVVTGVDIINPGL